MVTYHHLELDDHDVILAEGAQVETCLDMGDRAKFEAMTRPLNTGRVSRPGVLAREVCSDLELVVTGPRLDAIRLRLESRARRARQPA